ncbi:MAG: glycosyltransferase family 4 protein [Planctomycetes bacterium]|nr:glycosyltransferase family 4 protein [Planctomycetota bacterium]
MTMKTHTGEAMEHRRRQPIPDRKIKVAIIIEATIGGTREHLRQIARRINLRRFNVTVIASALRDPGFQQDMERMRRWGLRVLLLPMHREIRPGQDLLSLLWLCRHFAREGYDVVHTHSSKAGFLGRVAAGVSAVPHVFHTPHTFPFQSPRCSPLKGSFYRFLERFAGLFTEKMVLLSEAQRSLALGSGLLHEARTVVIPNGIAVRLPEELEASKVSRAELGLRDGDAVIGCVARLTWQKGHEHLLAAAAQLCGQRSDVSFALVGDGERRSELEREVDRLGLRGRVLFLGQREEARNIYPAFDLLAIPSLYEGLPYAALEAMAAGCPVVAFRLPELAELIVHGQTGLLAEPGQSEDLAQQILRLIEDGELRGRMAAEARRVVGERYSAGPFIEKLEALYSGEEYRPE